MELAQLLRVLRTHWVVIVLSTILGGGVAYGWSLVQPRVYEADATGTVTSTAASTDVGTALTYENLAKSKVKSYLQWAKTRSVAEYAIDELGLDVTPESLVSRISASNPADTPVITITAKASTPEAARDLATAWMNGLAAEGQRQDGGGDDAAATPVLELRVTESAVLPTSPASPNVKLAVAIGLVAGLIIGVVYGLLRNILDRRIRTAEQVEREFDLPVIGTIPIEKALATTERIGNAAGGETEDARMHHSPLSEAMRELRTNISFMNVDDPPKVIVVSSPLPGDGKSTVAANLALTIAASGQRVIIADADLRRPTVAKTFGLVEGVGLTDVLVGDAELVDVLQPWGTTGNLLVMGAGKHPPNPSELLGSKAMKQVLHELGQAAFVIVDAPPLIPVTDASVLAASTDGIIVVVSAGRTTSDALGKALANVDRVGVKPSGIILNRVPLRGPNSAYYGYGYDYRSAYTSSNGEAPAVTPARSRRRRTHVPTEPASA